MRTVYHEHLSELVEQLSRLCGLAGATMERATRALLQADLASAEQVISDYDKIAAMGTRAEESAITLLALQQPVAGELRSIISWIQVIADVDRMGALAVHVAKIVRQRHPEHVLPAEAEGSLRRNGPGRSLIGEKCAGSAVDPRSGQDRSHTRTRRLDG